MHFASSSQTILAVSSQVKILSHRPVEFEFMVWRAAIVTGLSNPTCCDLSISQLSLLADLNKACHRNLPMNNGNIVDRNFPFFANGLQPANEPNILSASLANLYQYLICRGAQYRTLAKPHWEGLFRSTTQLNVMTGSCGLELLARGLQDLSNSQIPKINVLACGPVASNRLVNSLVSQKKIQLVIIRGTRDWLANRKIRSKTLLVSGLGHLGYWDHPDVRSMVCKWLLDRISPS
ncbi:MAG: hypothetical protein KDB03_01910 [Planctomycetales bacterium]|nr:hypothetical protein [Planctomycetales bacterium]